MAIYPFSKKDQEKHGIVTTSDYGWRVRNGVKEFHQGLDLAPKDKAQDIIIVASESGQLVQKKDKFGGLYSYIRANNGKGYLTVHHLKFLRDDGPVKMADPIAIMGASGQATGVHTHFEIRKKWTDINSFTDPKKEGLVYLDDLILAKNEMVTIQTNLSIITTNTKDMRHRAEPNTTSKILGMVKPNTSFETKQVALGEAVNGNTTWYKYLNGWVNGAYCKELIKDCPPVPDHSKQLKQLDDIKKIANS